MATNPYINRVDIVRGNSTETLINISDTTALAGDVASGKYFYLATGEKVAGTSSGGGSDPDGNNLGYGNTTNNLVGSARADYAIVSNPNSDITGMALSDIATIVS